MLVPRPVSGKTAVHAQPSSMPSCGGRLRRGIHRWHRRMGYYHIRGGMVRWLNLPFCNAHTASPGIDTCQVLVPTGTDNTATEAGLDKLFTTKRPLSHFLQLIAAWSHAQGIALQPSHIPGKKNTWADDLSRD